MIYFTSDTHFGHKNIINYCNRPWFDTYHMDEALINNWNAIVKPEDIVYHLGDVSFKGRGATRPIIEALNGTIFLIRGNHDRSRICNMPRWAAVTIDMTIVVNDQQIYMKHRPADDWSNKEKGTIHLHGHLHGKDFLSMPGRVDVGVDCWDYRPITLEEILDAFSRTNF